MGFHGFLHQRTPPNLGERVSDGLRTHPLREQHLRFVGFLFPVAEVVHELVDKHGSGDIVGVSADTVCLLVDAGPVQP